MQRRSFSIVVAAIFAVFEAGVAFALPSAGTHAAANVSLKLQADIVEVDKGATKLVPVADESGFKPGEVVRYVIVATSSGPGAAQHLVPEGKIPAGTAYQAGSASKSDSLRVEFSLDGGKTWSAKPTVKLRTAAGLVERAADPSLYTTLRWIGAQPLLPRRSETYTYQVRIQ